MLIHLLSILIRQPKTTINHLKTYSAKNIERLKAMILQKVNKHVRFLLSPNITKENKSRVKEKL